MMGCSVKWIHLLSIVYALSSVSAEGVIGAVTPSARAAAAVPELCAACVTGCRTISGLFTRPQMPPGYSLVTQVPKGACRLVVSQLKHTRNFIALRNPNGTFILNGNYQDIGRNREVEAVGTRFTYRRQVPPHSEIITAPGPLAHPVDIMMVYNQPNPGIKYEYMIPIEQTVDHIAPPFIELKKPQTTDTVKPQIDPHKHQTDLYRPQPDLHKPTSDSHRTQTDSHRPQPDVHNPHSHVGHNRPHTDIHRPQPDQHKTQTDVHKPHNEVPVEPRRLDKPLTTLSQGDDSRPLRRRRRKFVWKITGMTSCSKTCGGGVQYPIVVCVREHNQAAVLERRCTGLEKPRNQTTRCNTQPCPAHWGGTWSACSATCGPGEQTRVLECLQEISATLTMRVKDGACLEPRPATTRRCDLAPCETRDNELEQELPSIAQWHTDHWSQCSVTCGTGIRTRSITCNGKCRAEDRPSHAESCHGPLCPSAHVLSQTPPASSTSISWWLATEWSEQCSEGCGTGTQSRWVTCPTGECDPNIKPDTSRACSSDKQCGGRWYTGPWGPCTDSCGATAKQKREVLCVVHVRGQARIVSDMTCPAIEKPVTEKTCEGTCPPRWFTGEWGTCEGQCPNGVQRREVRCLEYDGRYATSCTDDMPPLKRSCHCSLGLSTKTDYTSRESSQAQDEPLPDRSCVDQFTNCPLVVQARLCQYPYYKTSCCLSCRKNHQDPRE